MSASVENTDKPIDSVVEPTAEPKIEASNEATAGEVSSTEKKDAPKLSRNDTWDSINTDTADFDFSREPRNIDIFTDFNAPRPRYGRTNFRGPHGPPPPPPPQHYRRRDVSPSPRRRVTDSRVIPFLNSSKRLLENLNYDGIADLTTPSKSSIYLTTYPFADKHVKQWTWLFQTGIEDKILYEDDRDAGESSEDDLSGEEDWYDRGRNGRIRVHRNRRGMSPVYYNNNTIDIPTVYLSRALDTSVIPESAEDFTFLIVVHNRGLVGGRAKLLTAKSRKEAAILIYYEAMIGNSVAFVGAVKEWSGRPKGKGKAKKPKKYQMVANVDEIAKAAEDGLVGVIC